MPDTDPKSAAGAAAAASATVTPAFLKKVLEQSTAASTSAATQMAKALETLTAVMAEKQAVPARKERDLHDRKVPDFWESRPTTWFHVFESHLDNGTALSEAKKFSLLLPLLTSSAVEKVDRFVLAPPEAVYTKAKKALLDHFERDPMDRIADLYHLSSFGDRTATDFLDYMRSLQPGEPETKLFRYIFLKCMPPHVKAVVVKHEDLDAMAEAADVILKSVPSMDGYSSGPVQLSGTIAATSRELVDGLCAIHKKYGQDAYSCALPGSCRMKSVLKKKPGNGNAGRR